MTLPASAAALATRGSPLRSRLLVLPRTVVVFVRERFHLGVTIPMAFGVATGAVAEPALTVSMRLLSCTWCLLFAARVADDIADLQLDKARKPERALPAGRIAVPHLAGFGAAALATALVLLGVVGVPATSAAGLAAVSSALYYAFRWRTPAALRPLWINAPFLALALLWPLERGRVRLQDLLLALFVWLAVVGHDFAHSIEPSPEGQTQAIRAGTQAWVGASFFFLAAVAGGTFVGLTSDRAFAVALAVMSLWLGALLCKLLAAPDARNSSKIYVPGCLFFLAPLLCRVGQSYLGRLR